MTHEPGTQPEEKARREGGLSADATLQGYLRAHHRPPAFEGPDGHPYTVSMEVEKTPNLAAPYSGFLVFPRWADTGAGIIGHLETGLLVHCTSREEAEDILGALTLYEVNELLRETILGREEETE